MEVEKFKKKLSEYELAKELAFQGVSISFFFFFYHFELL